MEVNVLSLLEQKEHERTEKERHEEATDCMNHLSG